MEVQNMEQFTFYAHGSNSDPYSKYQCPINLAATLTGTVAELDEALYYMFMYMPTEITDDNYSADQLKKDLRRVHVVIDDILETKKTLLPYNLYSEVKKLRTTLFEVLFELYIYDTKGLRLDAYVTIPEGAKHNQLKTFLDKMRVPKLSSMHNKFKRYMKDYVSAYMFGFVDRVESFVSDKYVEYRMKDFDKALRVNIKFN